MRHTLFVLLVTMMFWGATLRVASAQEHAESGPKSPQARAHWERGLARFTAKDYEGAIAELQTSFGIEPRHDVLFAWAQAERLSGDCASAVVLYRKYLGMNPPPKPAQAARLNLERCEQALATRPSAPDGLPPSEAGGSTEDDAAAPVTSSELPGRTDVPVPRPEPIAAPHSSTPPPPRDQPVPRRFYQDWVGDVLVGSGIAAGAIGGWLIAGAHSDAGSAPSTYDQYNQRFYDAQTHATLGWSCVAVGGGLIGVGILRYWFHTRADSAASTALWLVPSATHAGLAAGGSF